MNTLSKCFPIALVASLASACAATPRATTIAASASPRICAGGTLGTDRDVQGMTGCRAVHGDLRITGAVTTLEPLASVRSVSGTLTIETVPELDSLDGLDQLRSVRAITLKNNPELENLHGLEGVRALERLTIEGNGIYTLSGLKNLEKVGELVIEGNQRLNDARALSGVLEADEVVLVDNRRLAGYAGILSNLQRQPRFVTIRGNELCAAETAHLVASTASARVKNHLSGINADAERPLAQF